MFSTTVVGPLDIAAGKGKKYLTRRESIVARAIVRETPRNSTVMPKELNIEYAQAVVGFKTRLAADKQKGHEDTSIIVHIEQGRKFDKVLLGRIVDGKARMQKVPAYFIDNRDGSVYGIKSPLSPNLNHFYGTIYDSDKWDWAGERAVPFNEDAASVVAVGAYGSYKHYVRKAKAVAVPA